MKKHILKISIILSLFLIVSTYASVTRKCSISFSSKGGIGTMEKMEAVKGSTIKINPCTYTREGYYFKGWEDDMGHTYDDQGYIVVDSDKHLYALWSKSGDSNGPQIVKTSNDEKILKDISEYQILRGLDPTSKPNTWYNVGGNLWYLIGSDGLPVRGWYEVKDAVWYYLDPETCLMATGWKVIDREYYYFAERVVEADWVFDKVKNEFVPNGNEKEIGQMYCDEYTPDGRYVNSQGVMINQYR